MGIIPTKHLVFLKLILEQRKTIVMTPDLNSSPRGHGFHNIDRELLGHRDHAFDFLKCILE